MNPDNFNHLGGKKKKKNTCNKVKKIVLKKYLISNFKSLQKVL